MIIESPTIPHRYDVAFLRPAYLPRRERFETADDARRAWQKAKRLLVGSTSARISRAIAAVERCFEDEEACQLPICPKCARAHRRLFGSQVLRTLPNGEDALRFVTILGNPIADRDLPTFSIEAFHDSVRQKLRGCGLGSIITMGGTEFARHTPEGGWVPHLHLIMRAPPQQALDELRARCRSTVELYRPMQAKPVDNLIGLCTYLQKFSLNDWPFERAGPTRSGARSLPKKQARLLARFLLRHSFGDFAFLVGCRRRGDEVMIEK